MTSTRKHLHTRSIHCQGFERDDGLWDIEATLTDTKTGSYPTHERGNIEEGEPIHCMKLCVTLNLDLVIQDIRVEMPYTPFQLCKSASNSMKNLIGLKIGSGWKREATQRIPKTDSCTHVMELLGPMSTTAYQTMHHAIESRENSKPARQQPAILNQCHSLASDSAVVRVMWPEFYTGKE